MNDLVERLRKRNTPYGWLELVDKAADRIEALEASLQRISEGELGFVIKMQTDRIEALEAALRKIAEDCYNDGGPTEMSEIARAALDPASQSSAGHSKDAGK